MPDNVYDMQAYLDQLRGSELYLAAEQLANECPLRLTPLDHLSTHFHVLDNGKFVRCYHVDRDTRFDTGYNLSPAQLRLIEARHSLTSGLEVPRHHGRH